MIYIILQVYTVSTVDVRTEAVSSNICTLYILQQIMKRKLNLFGHICTMKDNRLVKEVMFWRTEGQTRRGRPCRVGRRPGMVRKRNPHTQQEGAGSRHVENGGEDGVEHLRALSPWSNRWKGGHSATYSVYLPTCTYLTAYLPTYQPTCI